MPSTTTKELISDLLNNNNFSHNDGVYFFIKRLREVDFKLYQYALDILWGNQEYGILCKCSLPDLNEERQIYLASLTNLSYNSLEEFYNIDLSPPSLNNLIKNSSFIKTSEFILKYRSKITEEQRNFLLSKLDKFDRDTLTAFCLPHIPQKFRDAFADNTTAAAYMVLGGYQLPKKDLSYLITELTSRTYRQCQEVCKYSQFWINLVGQTELQPSHLNRIFSANILNNIDEFWSVWETLNLDVEFENYVKKFNTKNFSEFNALVNLATLRADVFSMENLLVIYQEATENAELQEAILNKSEFKEYLKARNINFIKLSGQNNALLLKLLPLFIEKFSKSTHEQIN